MRVPGPVFLLVSGLMAVCTVTTDGQNETEALPVKKCKSFSSRLNGPNMQSDVNITTGQITVNCVEGYLLVPEDGSVLECNGMIGEWIIPDCEEVPSVGFNRTSMVHDMRQKQLKIPVTLQPVVVREFNVTVTASPGTAAVTDDFKLITETLHFKEDDEGKNVVVNIINSGHSDINKNFSLCLSVVNEDGMEVRAKLNGIECVSVTINNTNFANLSILHPFYVFTSSDQLLSFSVGYRTCDIHVTISLPIGGDVMNRTITIPQNCTTCVVDLFKQSQNFTFNKKMIGEYVAQLTADEDNCKVNTNARMNVMIQVTLTLTEIEEKGTTVNFQETLNLVKVSAELTFDPDPPVIPLTFNPAPIYLFRLQMTLIGDAKDGTVMVDVDPSDVKLTGIDVTDFLTDLYMSDSGCSLRDTFELHLAALTTPSVAIIAKSKGGVTLGVNYGISVGFESSEYKNYKPYNTEVDSITIATTKCIDLPQYITISTDADGESGFEFKLMRTENPLRWVVLNVPATPLKPYKLSLKVRDNVTKDDKDLLTLDTSLNSSTYFSSAILQFGDELYHYKGKMNITIVSSRDLAGENLDEWVKLTYNPDILEIDYHVSPTKKNASKWEISVSVKENYKKKNVSVVITLANKTEEFITIGDCNTTTVHQYIEYIEVTPTTEGRTSDSSDVSVPVVAETSFSFTAMIAVLIAVVVVALVAYITFSRREQIVTWLKATRGGGDSGKGILTKVKTRLRSRGAYKKLPTSVQDAMTRHND